MNNLWDALARSNDQPAAIVHGPAASVVLADLVSGSILGDQLEHFRGRVVMLAMRDQLSTALALVELDGVAQRLILSTPDLSAEQINEVADIAQADAILVDGGTAAPETLQVATYAPAARATPKPEHVQRRASHTTEWILLTSGTTGLPKLVLHTFESLAGALPRQSDSIRPMVWSTFYDIRRYGGLQIYLRALLSGSPMVLSSAGEATRGFFIRAAAAGVTHISGTPSHWRRALMSGDACLISPEYVRLSGEVADQTILDNLRAAYPSARIGHAFASTEAGVAFEVNDGLAGFPADLIEKPGAIELQVRDGTLWIRSRRTAAKYLGENASTLASEDGFVDTGDMLELLADRYYFRGRKGGIINVGGLKVYPEEVEAVLNADSRVRMSLVKGRRSPITGAVIVAEVVLADDSVPDLQRTQDLKNELLNACRRNLAAHKVPALLRFVPALELTAAGKLVRAGA
ncbi:MAG TPA: long-chain fatty acid--CoA ligase [Steroidobacteraceae bacterium]